ncbi:MAG: hypothetical protein J6J13_01370 [Clostridia bacterium]|nr:hypothetical protein [Clostridia bacterium]MBP3705888.1 hypothetical protein [Clostridia bacterium]
MKNKIFLGFVYVMAFLTVCVNGAFSLYASLFPDINNLPQGRLIESIDNPQNETVLNIYLVQSSLGTAIRGEIQKGETKENVFWQTGIEQVECSWHNKETVVINSFYLDISRGDVYDCRNGTSMFQSNANTASQTDSQASTSEKSYE